METTSRFFSHVSNKSFFLFGPRGTGKSTLVKANYKDAYIIDLLEPEQRRSLTAVPSRLREIALSMPNIKIFILDEVQKVPDLLSVVHQLIEEKLELQFILTGSSSRKLKREGVDLLAGRAQLKFLHPFMAAEIGENFDLTTNLATGMLPLIVNSTDPKGDLHAYIALYMQEEVVAEGLVRKLDQFARFLEIISFSQGNEINYSNIARECSVSSNTIASFINILEDLLLAFRLNIFNKRAKRELQKTQKFYYFDVGVYQAIRPKGILDNQDVVPGCALETLVAQHLRAHLDYSEKTGELYFWRSKSGLEVDFVIYGEIGFFAIEVKATNNVNTKDLRGLKEFTKDYPECTAILLYQGTTRSLQHNIHHIPITEFLLHLKPNCELL